MGEFNPGISQSRGLEEIDISKRFAIFEGIVHILDEKDDGDQEGDDD